CCPTAPPLIPRLHAPAAPGLDAPSLHDALPTSRFGSFTRTDASTSPCTPGCRPPRSSVSSSSDPFALPSRLPDPSSPPTPRPRGSDEHTSALQSRAHVACPPPLLQTPCGTRPRP